jgi:hypothetical protein
MQNEDKRMKYEELTESQQQEIAEWGEDDDGDFWVDLQSGEIIRTERGLQSLFEAQNAPALRAGTIQPIE